MKTAVLYSPCDNCPFRKDVPIYLRADRRRDIADSLVDGSDFSCHKTTSYDESEEDLVSTSDSQTCAGAAKALMLAGGTTQMMRIAERLGMADLDRTEASPVEVWDLDQWPRLAEGSTGENPMWEVGDEYGVETCSVVGEGCEAPAGYMNGGAITKGTVAAEFHCQGCGEPMCGNCCGDFENMLYCTYCLEECQGGED